MAPILFFNKDFLSLIVSGMKNYGSISRVSAFHRPNTFPFSMRTNNGDNTALSNFDPSLEDMGGAFY